MKKFNRQLSDLSNPMPIDLDPESMINDSDSSNAFSNVSDHEEDNDLAVDHYIPVGKGKIRHALDLDISDPKYEGQRVSRKEMSFDSWSGSEQDEEIFDGSDSEQDDQIHEDEELDNFEYELENMHKEEHEMMKSISNVAKNDIKKGEHLQNQMTIWDGLLDIRIRFQKVIETANQLPIPENLEIFISKQPENLQSIQKSKVELVKLIDQLSTMQEEISSKKRKRDFSQDNIDLNVIFRDISEFHKEFIPKRNDIIDIWHQKVQSKIGGMVVQKKFKVINQSPVFQIQEALKSDLDRLIKRTQLKRSDYKILGSSQTTLNNSPNIDDQLSNHYQFIYDDNDFYQEMLKELVDSRIADSEDPALLGLKWSSIKAERKKNKKVVDTRASKGRKIRFNTHEKLENYMAPIPLGNWHDEMSEELFACLFGMSLRTQSDTLNEGTDGFEIFSKK